MKNKFLIVATVPSMIGQFNMNNIHILLDMGYEVHVACNYKDRSVWEEEKICTLRKELKRLEVRQIQVDFARSPYYVSKLIKAYIKLHAVIKNEEYAGLHCHTPVGGMVARLAARETKTKVIYTAHGFHFYKGAPLKNWLLYYPVEKLCSRWTDVLITINKEDYALARKKMHAKKVEYVPGVGIDTEKFGTGRKEENRERIRVELGIPKEARLLLSVGELNENKNHETVIRALAKLPEIKGDKIYYAIAGKGELEEKLRKLIKDLSLESQVFLLGFREDMAAIYDAADIFIFPSKREGLGLAAIEAMAMGLPLVTSNVHGIKDYSINGITGFNVSPTDYKGFANAIKMLIADKNLRETISKHNIKEAQKYDRKKVSEYMKKLYYQISME